MAGRPTKYKTEYSTDEFVTKFIRHCQTRGELVSLCGLAVYLKVCEETLQEWGREHKSFSVSMRKINQKSKQTLLNKGLTNKYNANMARFVLSANHNMAEKTETKHGLDKATATLMGLIDGTSKGVLPAAEEAKDG